MTSTLNFIVLMVLTVIEVAAVFFGESMSLGMVWAILIRRWYRQDTGIGPFMHLAGDPRSYLLEFRLPLRVRHPDALGHQARNQVASPASGLVHAVARAVTPRRPEAFTWALLAAVAMVLLLLHLPSASPTAGWCCPAEAWARSTLSTNMGRTFPWTALKHPSWVAFIYTSCPDVCPVITQTLKAVQNDLPAELEGKVDFISITVDPARDNPETLLAFTELHGVTWPHLDRGRESRRRLGTLRCRLAKRGHRSARGPDFAVEAATVTHEAKRNEHGTRLLPHRMEPDR